MVRIVLPSVWTNGDRSEFETAAGPLPEVIKRFAADNPEYRRRLLAANSEPHNFINICVDDDLIPRHLRSVTTVPPGSTVTIISPMAGG